MAPPLGCQDGIIRKELYAKVRHGQLATPFVTWAESLSTQTDRIWVKTFLFGHFESNSGLNLSEDLFFWSSPNFG